MITCANCEKQVIPTKAFDWAIFIILLVLGGIGGLLYLVYYGSKAARECPACAADVYTGQRTRAPEPGGLRDVTRNGVVYRYVPGEGYIRADMITPAQGSAP
jgi:hypothetical protein